MAIKVKRRQTRREAAKEPDQIYTFSESLFNYLETHRRGFLIGLVLVLLGVIIFTALTGRWSRAATRAGAQMTEASLVLTAPVGDDSSEAPGDGLRFASRQARSEAVRESLADVMEDPTPAAMLFDAVSSLALGDVGRAQERFQVAASQEELPLLAAVSLQGWAATEAEGQDLAAALGTLDQLSERYPELTDYAEVEAARLNEAAGNLEQAHQLYRRVAASSVLATGSQGALAEIARHRADVLAVLLGERATAENQSDEPSLPTEPDGE